MTRRTRREILREALAVAGLGALGIPEWALPALAQGEALVPFTDLPENINLNPAADRRSIDIRQIDGPFTPKDQFYTIQHYGHPEVDPATYGWNGATPGEHTLVSRVTDVHGRVQPTSEDLASKKTFLEDNSQFPRKVMIA